MYLKKRAQGLKKDIPAVFIALKSKETPLSAKIMAAVTICYALSPIDLIPDFIPILGYLDDIILLPIMVYITVRLIPKDIFERCSAEAENLWKNGRPKKAIFAIPIILIWIMVLICIFRAVFSLAAKA